MNSLTNVRLDGRLKHSKFALEQSHVDINTWLVLPYLLDQLLEHGRNVCAFAAVLFQTNQSFVQAIAGEQANGLSHIEGPTGKDGKGHNLS